MKLQLNRRTDLALMALRELASAPEGLKGAEIARRIGTSVSFLPQIMAPLVQRRWVASERGPAGGYLLRAEAEEARLLDVIEATEGPSVDGRCVMRDGSCPGELACPIHAVWMEAREVLTSGFQRMPAFVVTEGVTR
jgi:Rrf2 family iron-sulfur cluster assembly transcriptional regulator